MIEERNGEVYYVPTVKTQNAGKAVEFKMTYSTDKEWVFENPQHDFPQKITYTMITGDSLVAEISGTIEGQLRSEKFPMKKAS